MSDDQDQVNDQGTGDTPPDLGAFEKIENQVGQVSSELAKNNQAMSAILEHLQNQGQQANAQAVQDTATSVNEVDYDSMTTDQIVSHIESKVESKFSEKLEKQQTAQQEYQSALSRVQADYPEAGVKDHDMQKKILEQHSSLPPSLKNTGEGIELAALRAAQELGLQPKGKRTDKGADEFNLQPGKRRSTDTGENDVSLETRQWAEALLPHVGIDPNDKDVKKRLKENSNRKWTRYK